VGQLLAQPLFLLPDEFHQGNVDLPSDMMGQSLGEVLKELIEDGAKGWRA
jgi:hypothetical protein